MGGPPGVRFVVRLIRVGSVGIELFQFLEPKHPTVGSHQSRYSVMHFALHVPDVVATIERVERAGGTSLWPEHVTWGRTTTVYVEDPDHNVIELLSDSFEDVAKMTIALRPEADPVSSPWPSG